MNPRSIGLFLLLCATPAVAQVATGIDVLEQQNFAPLKEIAARHGGHLRLGVLTNPVGLDAHERRTIDVLRKDAAAAVPGLSVKVIFTAEHGINAAVDKFDIDNGTDTESGLPIVSISGSKPSQKRNRVVTSCNSQPLPSGSLNVTNELRLARSGAAPLMRPVAPTGSN